MTDRLLLYRYGTAWTTQRPPASPYTAPADEIAWFERVETLVPVEPDDLASREEQQR